MAVLDGHSYNRRRTDEGADTKVLLSREHSALISAEH
jgi:hypothetical protein